MAFGSASPRVAAAGHFRPLMGPLVTPAAHEPDDLERPALRPSACPDEVGYDRGLVDSRLKQPSDD